MESSGKGSSKVSPASLVEAPKHEIGVLGNTVGILQSNEMLNPKPYGSRMIGGKKPYNIDKYRQYEATSYIVPDTADQESQYMRMTPKDYARRRLLMWVRYAFTGVVVSIVISGALFLTNIIEKWRVKSTTKILDNADIGGAWMFWVGTSVGMNLFACTLVLLNPAAASSGIPGLIAFLNGVEPAGGVSNITKKKTSFTSIRTMVVKFVGMVASIPSGLCIGPEGPIIHISSLLAYWSTAFVHYVEDKVWGWQFDRETNAERRDFLATGAACGICTAFRAPLAGTLFVVEEAGSFFTTKHLEYTFFASLIAYWVQWTLGFQSGEEGATDAKFQQTTGYFCNVDNPLNMVAYFILAVVGGVLGALFNQIVEKLNHFRARHVNKRWWARVGEILFITILTGTAVVFLPMNASCRALTRDVMLEDGAGCFPEYDRFQISYGAASHGFVKKLVDAAAVNKNSSTFSNETRTFLNEMELHVRDHRVVPSHRDYPEYDVLLLDNVNEKGPYIHLHYEHAYTCGESGKTYNDMAMLWLNGGVKGVKTLMQRGFPHQISEETLILFLVVYFTLAAITSGTHVPAGLVVPMLLIGGAFGRLFGIWWLKIKAGMCSNYEALGTDYDIYHWASTYRWIVRDCKLPDPGTFAVIGMAAFMGGSGRISVMLSVVMLELTGDVGLVAPVGITCIVAMIVGNMFNHGLYHGLIPIMNLPFLNSEPAQVMYVTRVSEVMSSKVVYLPQHCEESHLRALQKQMESGKITHNAFPVVVGNNNRRLVGLLRSTEMFRLLSHLETGGDDLLRRIKHKTYKTIDLMQYCDRSPLTVSAASTVARAYEVFRKLGLRHLVVLGLTGEVVGMITRKDLMLFKILIEKKKELSVIIKLQKKVRHRLRSKGFYKGGGAEPYGSDFSESKDDQETEKEIENSLKKTMSMI
jgi:chloride channel 7